MTVLSPVDKLNFAYRAQTAQGQTLSGTIEAFDLEDAQRQLRAVGLRIIDIEPSDRPAARRAGGELRGEDFLSFNQQLAHLTRAGLPVEHGLRLIAQDMRRGRLRRTVDQLADELHGGTPLPQAFDKFRHRFPPLYARLVEAGIRSNNLAGMLLNLGRHVEMVQRLRASLWRTASYPLMILLGLVAVLIVITIFVLPQMEMMYRSFAEVRTVSLTGTPISPRLPAISRAMFAIGGWLPYALFAILALAVVLPIVWRLLRWIGWDRAIGDMLLLPLPLVGPVMRWNLVARWVDALRIAVVAGMDLPGAIAVAGDAVGSPRLRRDGQALIEALERGEPLTQAQLRLLPAALPAALELGTRAADLPTMLDTLTQMYQQQSEARLRMVPVVLTPLLLLLVAGSIGFVIAGITMPMFRIFEYISGPW
jgi:type II secretory pathway component PulF